MNEFKLGNRMVGYQHPPLVIAEIGINHNGSLDSAISLADDAIDSGIEVIKHQTHVVEDEMTSEARSVIPGNSDKSIYQIMEECALNEDDETSLKEHVESRGKFLLVHLSLELLLIGLKEWEFLVIKLDLVNVITIH